MDKTEPHIMNLHNDIAPAKEQRIPDQADAGIGARKEWDVNTTIDRWAICVGDAISHYNSVFPDDKVFLYNDKPAHIDVDKDGVTKITLMDIQQVRTVLGKGAAWYRAKDEVQITMNPPKDMAEWTLSAGRRELENVPVLEGVTAGILIDKDWRVVCTEGYDEKTRYYLTKEYAVDPVPDVPTAEQISEAKETIWEVFKEVRYKDKDQGQNSVNYQNTVFGLVAAVLRPSWKGALPMVVIKKSSPRIGGSVLAELIGIFATGNARIRKLTYPDTAHEYATKIEAAIMEGIPYCSVDNVTSKYVWYTPTLLTQSIIDGWVDLREFRKNTSMNSCPPKTFFSFNGINMDITKDVCGRVIPIYLENNKVWQIDKFDVTEDDLREKAITLYPKIIWSIAVLHQNWVANGQPEPPECNGNISAYQRLWHEVGGMLHCAGFTHVLENLKEAQTDYNEADNMVADFLNALGRTYPHGEKFTPTKLGELITSQAQDKKKRYDTGTKQYGNSDQLELINTVPEELFEKASRMQLAPETVGGYLSKNYLGMVVNGAEYTLRKGKSNGNTVYWLEDRCPL